VLFCGIDFGRWTSLLCLCLRPGAAGRGLSAKPVIDSMISVHDIGEELSYLPACICTGLILRAGHGRSMSATPATGCAVCRLRQRHRLLGSVA
jgi:hypothetical protein